MKRCRKNAFLENRRGNGFQAVETEVASGVPCRDGSCKSSDDFYSLKQLFLAHSRVVDVRSHKFDCVTRLLNALWGPCCYQSVKVPNLCFEKLQGMKNSKRFVFEFNGYR